MCSTVPPPSSTSRRSAIAHSLLPLRYRVSRLTLLSSFLPPLASGLNVQMASQLAGRATLVWERLVSTDPSWAVETVCVAAALNCSHARVRPPTHAPSPLPLSPHMCTLLSLCFLRRSTGLSRRQLSRLSQTLASEYTRTTLQLQRIRTRSQLGRLPRLRGRWRGRLLVSLSLNPSLAVVIQTECMPQQGQSTFSPATPPP